MSRQAELIVQGTIVSKTCQRDPEDRIYTRVELKVTDVWKGAVTSSPMIIVHSGGVLGEQRSTAAGQVNYDIGEEVVCFLVRNGRGEAVTLGLMQGKFHVWTDPATKTKWVASPFHGAPPGTSQPTRARVQSAAAGPGDPLSLADLKKTVAEVNR